MITDEQAADARLVLVSWFVQSGADLSSHFTSPRTDSGSSGTVEPLGVVLVRGATGVEQLRAWSRQMKEGKVSVPAGAPSMVRPFDDIQKAHDVLWAVANDQKMAERIGLNVWDRKLIEAALEVFCYVLRHEHSQAFEGMLNRIIDAAEKAGYRLRVGPPGTRPEIGMADVEDGDA